jgi:hypothetical protein
VAGGTQSLLPAVIGHRSVDSVMNDRSRVGRRTRRVWPPAARTAAALIATTSLALLVSGCGGASNAGGPTTSESTSSPEMLAFSRCMRSHSVPNFPDPNSSGELPKNQLAQLAASNPQFPAAHRACEHLLPNGGQPTPAQVRQAWNDMRNFARCMRSHGVPNWPDPTATSPQDQRPFFHTPASIDPTAPEITTKIRACQYLLHANNPLVTTQ